MKIVQSVNEMINLTYTYRSGGKTIGLVPTMGALHEGHLSLLTIAQKNVDVTIMSIFVNPLQFGPNEDYTRYPRPFDTDCHLAEKAGCDILFAPSSHEMYPPENRTFVEVGGMSERLCGASRPNHFRGVATVVLKFINIVRPHVAIFGAKDAQQVIILRRMVADLHCRVRILVGPIIRESDGLALSSRNAYLSKEERSAAPALHRSIKLAESLFAGGTRNTAEIKSIVLQELGQTPIIRTEYIELVDCITLDSLDYIDSSALLAVACRMGESSTRLIDNTILGGIL